METAADSIYTSYDNMPEIQTGYTTYREYGCILCHGLNGEGGVKNKNAQTGELIPALTYVAEGYLEREFQVRVLKGVQDVAKLVPSGDVPPLTMPGWERMSDLELDALTKYVWNLYPENEEDDDW